MRFTDDFVIEVLYNETEERRLCYNLLSLIQLFIKIKFDLKSTIEKNRLVGRVNSNNIFIIDCVKKEESHKDTYSLEGKIFNFISQSFVSLKKLHNKQEIKDWFLDVVNMEKDF